MNVKNYLIVFIVLILHEPMQQKAVDLDYPLPNRL